MSKLIVNEITKYDASQVTFTDNTNVTITGSLSTAGASVGGTLAVSGAATLSSTLAVTGVSTLTGNVLVGGAVAGNAGTVTVNVGEAGVTAGGLQLWAGTAQTSFIQFGDESGTSANHYRGFIAYAHGNDSLQLGSATTERMRIHSGGDISFRDSSANEAFYWDASAASLGIGTNNPFSQDQSANNLVVEDAAGNGGITIKTPTNAYGSVHFSDGTGTDAYRGILAYNHSDNSMQFSTNASERMRIDSSGNVGIGTGTLDRKLVVQGAGDQFIKIKGSYANNSGLIFGDIDLDAESCAIRNDRENNALWFSTGGIGNERMRITTGGYSKASNNGSYLNATAAYHEHRQSANDEVICYDTHSGTSPYGNIIRFSDSAPNNTTNWFIACTDTADTKFIVYSNGNVVNANNSYGGISDAKLKENVVDASPKLEDLMQVQVRNFNYIGDDKKQLGVVAQELEQVFPSMIDESPDFEEVEVPQLDENGQEVLDENGEVVMTKERVDLGTVTKSVKYSVFVPMLIKAIQELNAKVESLEAQLNA